MLNQEFFNKPAHELAEALLGCVLTHETDAGTTSGIIVETEAYHQDDEGSHSFNGMTPRTKVMFGPAGYAYVYFTYGMHYCFNVVSGEEGHGSAVLIRALQPVGGLDLMRARRGKTLERDLCSGPAKLVQAMGISKADYGRPLFEGKLYISEPKISGFRVSNGPRIGISKAIDAPLRFWITGNQFISKP